MAIHTHDHSSASVLPLSAVLSAIPSYPRPVIERLVARLIDRLDGEDGDPDVELNGDELDGTWGEDDFIDFSLDHIEFGAGCPVSDPPEDCGDAEHGEQPSIM